MTEENLKNIRNKWLEIVKGKLLSKDMKHIIEDIRMEPNTHGVSSVSVVGFDPNHVMPYMVYPLETWLRDNKYL